MRIRLDEDAATDEPLASDVSTHIEGCADCERYRERLAAIRAPASFLSREIPPPRDLWPGIASRLEATASENVERKIWRIGKFVPLAAAAGIAALLATSLFSVPSRQRETVSRTPSREVQAVSYSPTPRLPAETVEIGFVQPRAALMRRFEAQKSSAPPEQVAVVELTLATMQAAVRDIHAALERDPYNTSLLLKLSHARRRELQLLQQVVL